MVQKMLTNKGFLKLLSDACKSEDMDKYLNERLSTYFPYDLVFGKEER